MKFKEGDKVRWYGANGVVLHPDPDAPTKYIIRCGETYDAFQASVYESELIRIYDEEGDISRWEDEGGNYEHTD